jgi:hypothetical protein
MFMLAALLATADPMVAPLVERFRISVPDAREVRDLQVCQPRKASRDGRSFLLDVALSRPHAPRQYFVAKWRDGRVVQLIPYGVDSSVGENAGLDTLVLHSTERRFEPCRWVPKAELEAAWLALEGDQPQ